jgi:hypothetical protein
MVRRVQGAGVGRSVGRGCGVEIPWLLRALERHALMLCALCQATGLGARTPVHAALWVPAGFGVIHLAHFRDLTLSRPHPPDDLDDPIDYEPLSPFCGSLPAALPALTHLRGSSCRDVDVSGLTGLRRLAVTAAGNEEESCRAVEGLSGLAALEDLRLVECGEDGPLARPSDLAPLTALTRLAMTCVPPELASHPLAARLRRLELQAFGVLGDAPGGGGGSGADGAAAAALAALARGAPLLERLRIRVEDCYDWDAEDGAAAILCDHPHGVVLGPPLGAGVVWPSLTHLHVTPWAAVLLAGCTFPRLSRLVARIDNRGPGKDNALREEPLQAALAALAAKARDDVALRVKEDCGLRLAAAASVPGLRHLSWTRPWDRDIAGTVPPGDWVRLAPSLQSLDLEGNVAAYCEALGALTGALTGLTQLCVTVADDFGPAGDAPARVARMLAGLPRLAHLRLISRARFWGAPAVAAELARCPALRLLEVENPYKPLWRHELGPAHGANPRMPRPSPLWPPFAEALRAGGCRAAVRPGPADWPLVPREEFDIEV